MELGQMAARVGTIFDAGISRVETNRTRPPSELNNETSVFRKTAISNFH